MFWVILHSFLPHPDRLYHWFSEAVGYDYWFFSFLKPRVISWHRKSLLSLDRDFALEEGQKDVVRKRNEYLAKGGDPLDSGYPEIMMWDFPPSSRENNIRRKMK
ncbi:MAG: hypothetical protein IPN70_00700 [Candidatus Moraniibacteriota bacterium]|nr:MAG: hypothetical protein IPN70_00700 [Candidatus Moranbacteria bacterium]